jgi:hypothetical protein
LLQRQVSKRSGGQDDKRSGVSVLGEEASDSEDERSRSKSNQIKSNIYFSGRHTSNS